MRNYEDDIFPDEEEAVKVFDEEEDYYYYEEEEDYYYEDDEEDGGGEKTADSWPRELAYAAARGTPLSDLPPSYHWAKWLLCELSTMDALEDPETEAHYDVLNLQFCSGVILNGDAGNGQRLVARSVIHALARSWVRLTRKDWQKNPQEASLEKLKQYLEENRDGSLCLWIEDLSCCPYAEELADYLADCAEKLPPHTFYMVVLEDDWKIPKYLSRNLLICTFRNPDREEREEYLKMRLKVPKLLLADEIWKILLDKTEGFSYSDMEQLLHWLRIKQRDILITTKFILNPNEKLKAMEKEEYIGLLEECEISKEEIEDLIGLLHKDTPAWKTAVPQVIIQQEGGQQPVQQDGVLDIEPPDPDMPIEEKVKYYTTQLEQKIKNMSLDDQLRAFEEAHRIITGGGTKNR